MPREPLGLLVLKERQADKAVLVFPQTKECFVCLGQSQTPEVSQAVWALSPQQTPTFGVSHMIIIIIFFNLSIRLPDKQAAPAFPHPLARCGNASPPRLLAPLASERGREPGASFPMLTAGNEWRLQLSFFARTQHPG